MKNISVILFFCLLSSNSFAFSRGPLVCKGDLTLRSVVKDKPKIFESGTNTFDPAEYYNLEVLEDKKVIGILLPDDGIHFEARSDFVQFRTDNENYIEISMKSDSKKGTLSCFF